jgi:hypothetical protein
MQPQFKAKILALSNEPICERFLLSLFHMKMEADTASETQLSFPSGMMGNA